MLFAPKLADRAILPTAWGGRYFFNRIGQKRTDLLKTEKGLTGASEVPALWVYSIRSFCWNVSTRTDDGERLRPTCHRDIQMLSVKRVCIKDDGMVVFQTFDQQRCPNELPVAERPPRMPHFALVQVCGL